MARHIIKVSSTHSFAVLTNISSPHPDPPHPDTTRVQWTSAVITTARSGRATPRPPLADMVPSPAPSPTLPALSPPSAAGIPSPTPDASRSGRAPSPRRQDPASASPSAATRSSPFTAPPLPAPASAPPATGSLPRGRAAEALAAIAREVGPLVAEAEAEGFVGGACECDERPRDLESIRDAVDLRRYEHVGVFYADIKGP